MAAPPLVQLTELPGRGRSLISTRHIHPGELILTDSPLLHYPSTTATSFLSAAHSLSLTSPSIFHSLLSLSPSPSPPPSRLPPSPFPPSLTSSLLSIDRANAFALSDSTRNVHSCAIYPLASFFNHDCLPNAARFDSPDPSSPLLSVRAIHDIPAGQEVCISYFPVNWTYKERQERLMEIYGFRCECDRCRVEVNWKEEDEMEEEGEEEAEGDFPHAYFFVRYLCDDEECGGTLAPLPPVEGKVSDVLECNVCGKMRKEEEEEGSDGDMVDD